MRPRRGTAADRVLLGALTVATALTVLVILHVRTTRLGDDPSLAWDCDDSCTDLWADARSHYARTADLTAVAAALGWALIGSSRPWIQSTARPYRSWQLVAALVGTVIVNGALALANILLYFLGHPALVLGNVVAALLTAVLAWWVLRRRSRRDAWSWWVAAAIALGGTAAGWLVIAIGWWGSGIPVVLLGLLMPALVDVAAVLTLVTRYPTPANGARALAVDADAAPAERARRRYGSTLVSAALAVVVIAVGARAAQPVDAPPADATEASAGPTPLAASSRPAPGGTPSPTATPVVASIVPPPSDWPTCAGENLSMTVEDWDAAVGNGYAVLVATNTGDTPCVLSDAPLLDLSQGGNDLHLVQEALEETRSIAATPPASGVGLPTGASAEAGLFWPGYRTAADQTTPEVLTARVEEAGAVVPVALGADGVGDVPTAPFDLVDGGAIEVGRWAPHSG